MHLEMDGSKYGTGPRTHCTTDVVPVLTLTETNDRPRPVEQRMVGVVQ